MTRTLPAERGPRKPGQPGGFGSAARRYRRRGFLGTLPLPPSEKHPPPAGFTGGGKPHPTDAQLSQWIRQQPRGNIALRLAEVPRGLLDDRDDLPPIYAGNNVDGWELVGIDVDNYSKGDGPPKRGAEQLRDLESELGQLPVTALSGARLHTGSCIAVYLVPKSYRFTGKAADSIEVIQKRHRYMVVHPSTNPDAKGADGQPAIYEWGRGAPSKLADAGAESLERFEDGMPTLADIAVLPEAWFTRLTRGGMGETEDPISEMTDGELWEWLKNRPGYGDAMCSLMKAAVDEWVAKIEASASSHDVLRDAQWRLLNLAAEGHAGIAAALEEVTRTGLPAALGKRDVETLSAEVGRSIAGALDKIQPRWRMASGRDYVPDDRCAIDTTRFDCDAWAERVLGRLGDDSVTGGEASELVHEAELAYRRRKADQLARQRLAVEDWREPDDEGDLNYQIANPEPDEGDLVAGLVRSRGIVLVNAQYKTGKTTLASVNLPKALVTGRPFLRKFGVAFGSDECVGIWNLEVDRQDLVDWLERAEIPPEQRDRIFPKCLRGNRSVDFRNERAIEWTVQWLRDRRITVWIIDPLSKLYRGEENSSTEFNEWWSALEEIMRRAGVRVTVLVHHSGHGGEGRARGTSAMMGNPDVLIEYRHGGEHGELPPDNKRYLRTFGRRIDQPNVTLDFNPVTLELFVDENGGTRAENQNRHLALRLWDALKAADKPLNQGELFAAAGRKAKGKNTARARAAIDYAQGEGWITVEKSGNANLHSVGAVDPYAGHRVRLNSPGEGDVTE